MKVEARLFLGVAVFCWVAAAIVRRLDRPAEQLSHGQIEVAGVAALILSGGLLGISGSFFWFVSRRIDPRPEDRNDAEIAEASRRAGLLQPGSLLADRPGRRRHRHRPRAGLLPDLAGAGRRARRCCSPSAACCSSTTSAGALQSADRYRLDGADSVRSRICASSARCRPPRRARRACELEVEPSPRAIVGTDAACSPACRRDTIRTRRVGSGRRRRPLAMPRRRIAARGRTCSRPRCARRRDAPAPLHAAASRRDRDRPTAPAGAGAVDGVSGSVGELTLVGAGAAGRVAAVDGGLLGLLARLELVELLLDLRLLLHRVEEPADVPERRRRRRACSSASAPGSRRSRAGRGRARRSARAAGAPR